MVSEKETTTNETAIPRPPWSRRKIGIAEAAEILGVKPATLYNWAKEGNIEYIQYGPHGRMLFFQDVVLKYLEDHILTPHPKNPPSSAQSQK